MELEYRSMTDEELVASYDNSDEYIPEQEKEICRRVGLEEVWYYAGVEEFEAVLQQALEILRTKT